MIAEIISIGDELLIGHTVNSNAAYLGKGLTTLGVDVKWITTVGDDAAELRTALGRALERSDVVIATGGLGPTHDDITKHVAADFFESEFIFKPEIVERLKRAFAKRGLPWSAVNENQGQVPEKAELLHNPVGTAPGLLFKQNEKRCFILPGVPSEMKAICEESVFPVLRATGRRIVIKTVRTTGVAESVLFERLGDVKKIEENVKVAFLPKRAGVDIRLTARGRDPEVCQQKIAEAVALVLERAGDFVYGFDDDEMEDVVARLLTERKKTVAVAESCTGGLLSDKLTNISGSSNYFERGVIAYSNEAKMQLLGVSEKTLVAHGAVSPEVAVAMAEGVRRISGADFGVSTTGIAGPTGGTKDKPVGLIFVGMATAERSCSERFLFTRDRLFNKGRFAQAALNMLRLELL